jgi:hypothetical protein
MPRFLIEVPHEAEKIACARAVRVLLQAGSHYLTHADIGLFVLAALGGGVFARQALAGLPGYFEWVLWEETELVGAGASSTEPRAFRWVVEPYSRRTDCETDGDRLAARTLRQGASLAARCSVCPVP